MWSSCPRCRLEWSYVAVFGWQAALLLTGGDYVKNLGSVLVLGFPL